MPELTFREALRQALREEMLRDERVFLMGEDIGAYGGSYAVTRGLLEEFGEKRVKDTPIAEAAIVGLATGAAIGGLKPVAELMTINFSLLAADQIINHLAKLYYMFGGQFTAPAVIRTAAGWGQLGATHSQFLEVIYSHIPGLKVVMPSTPYDAKGLLKAAIRDPDPVLFIEHTLLYGVRGEVPDEEYLVPIGLADVKRPGRDVTIVAYARMVHVAMGAARQLEAEGVDCEIVDLRTLRPLDIETVIESVKKTNHVVVVEEDWKSFGVGAEVAARIAEQAFDYLDAPVVRVGMLEVPMPYNRTLERHVVPDEADVVAAVRSVVGSRV
jgi:pyruvate dehydrogenase E1 component beta subunit